MIGSSQVQRRADRCTPDSVLTVIYLKAKGLGDDCRQGITPLGVITATGMDPPREPIPPALLPARHSPSRRRRRRRWWSLTPPFHPSPTGTGQRLVPVGWFALCCSCRQACACLDLLFHPVTLPLGAGSREVPLGSESQRRSPCLPATDRLC